MAVYFGRREGAEARDVHRKDVLSRIALGHPARQHQSDPAPLAEAGHHRARDPVVAHAAHRADQRIAVGSEGERTVDRLADPDAAERREVPEAHFEVGRQPLEVLRQQLHGEVLRRLQRRPDDAVRLVGADERAAALLAQVDLARVVGGVDDLLGAALKLRQVLGDEVVVLHGEHRQLDADHLPDLAGPQSGAVHDVLGVHRALVGDAHPRSRRGAA